MIIYSYVLFTTTTTKMTITTGLKVVVVIIMIMCMKPMMYIKYKINYIYMFCVLNTLYYNKGKEFLIL